MRVTKGAVAPELRSAERRLDGLFSPTFGQSDISNRAELFWKQFRGFLRDPPKTGELRRGVDPTTETLEDKMRSRDLDRAFFLGRRVEVFVRQRADGSIVEMALRNPSGYRAFDDVALAAVEKAVAGRAPGVARAGEVRTLWQLDATAYVVVSPEPELVFDESTGKREWRYPLQKRVDHHVRLLAVYSAQQRLEHLRIDRLDHVPIEAGFARAPRLLVAVVAGERDEAHARGGAVGAQAARDLVAVDVGETNVAEHDLGGQRARGRDAVFAGERDAHLVPGLAQHLVHQVGGVLMILDDDDAHAEHQCDRSREPPPAGTV